MKSTGRIGSALFASLARSTALICFLPHSAKAQWLDWITYAYSQSATPLQAKHESKRRLIIHQDWRLTGAFGLCGGFVVGGATGVAVGFVVGGSLKDGVGGAGDGASVRILGLRVSLTKQHRLCREASRGVPFAAAAAAAA